MKTYHITLQGQDYTICLRSYSVEINGTRYKIRSLPARKLLFLTMEVDLPISGAHVMLVSGLWSHGAGGGRRDAAHRQALHPHRQNPGVGLCGVCP